MDKKPKDKAKGKIKTDAVKLKIKGSASEVKNAIKKIVK